MIKQGPDLRAQQNAIAFASQPRLRLQLHFFLILVLYLALGVAYSFVVPLWESPDEPNHLLYVRQLSTNHSLPNVPLTASFTENDEGGQAPLYYVLGALITSGIDMNNLDQLRLNPYRTWPDHPTGWAMYEHTQDEGFPWRGAALAGHLVRLLSVALGAGTLICVYLVAQVAFPRETGVALLSAALLAFNPGFVAVTSVVNNDSAVAFTSSFAVLLVCLALASSKGGPSSWWIGIATGLAFLAKANALLLLPFALIPAFFSAGSYRTRIASASRVIGGALAISGFWYAWNWWQFGTPIRKEASLVLDSTADWRNGVSPEALWHTGEGLFRSFWGFSGWTSLTLPSWVYIILAAVSAAGLAGLILAWHSESWWPLRRENSCRLLLIALPLVFLVVVVIRAAATQIPGFDHARFLLPAVASVALFAKGLNQLARALRAAFMLPAIAIGLGCFAAVSPWAFILPSFPAALPVWRGTSPEAISHKVSFQVGENVELLGYRGGETVRQGDDLKLTVYWQSRQETDQDLHVFIYLLDSTGKTLVHADGEPANGLYPSPTWLSGEVIADDRSIFVGPDVPPGKYSIGIGMYSWPDLDRQAVTVGGTEVPDGIAIVGTVTVGGGG